VAEISRWKKLRKDDNLLKLVSVGVIVIPSFSNIISLLPSSIGDVKSVP
jgi:hypothetical protein